MALNHIRMTFRNPNDDPWENHQILMATVADVIRNHKMNGKSAKLMIFVNQGWFPETFKMTWENRQICHGNQGAMTETQGMNLAKMPQIGMATKVMMTETT